jgi:N-acetylglucosaminyldiphosphoundecaprenol N-acetyl-beta-D-mannosaminyltransferase
MSQRMTNVRAEAQPTGSGALRTVTLLGVPLHDITSAEVLEEMARALASGRGGWILTPNLAILQRLVRDEGYREVCEGATIRVADGMPLVWASKLQRTPLRERVAGSDMIWRVSERAAREGWRVFFLGGNPGAAEAAAARLAEIYPGLKIAGTQCPRMGFERDAASMEGLRAQIRAGAPDVCFVALSGEKQDRLIRELMKESPRTWFLGIGISFSFVSGEVRRAPQWLQRCGLEWAHRLSQEPRRLAKRYLVDGIPFAGRLLLTSAWEGVAGEYGGGSPGRREEHRSRRQRRDEAEPVRLGSR